jgi:hypothetical protein
VRVYGYPQPGKLKSEEILVAFAKGAPGGYIRTLPELVDGFAAAFYGTLGLEQLLAAARARAALGLGDYFYIDNAYFDVARRRYFRVSRNALQRAGSTPDLSRLDELGISIEPWRRAGRGILVVEQSDYFLREVCGYPGGLAAWRENVMRELARHTDRPIRVRSWMRDKSKAAATLEEDLASAWALVTHASAAAVTAVLAGVPVFLTGETPALEVGLSQFSSIERPRYPDGRREWAARLAASQWRLDEMASGRAWRALEAQLEEARQ